MQLPSYRDFPRIARRSRWDADAVDLAGDAAAWPKLEPRVAAPIASLLSGFLVGERAVATDIRPFEARAPSAEIAACFAAQAADEDRHRRFFERVHAEVLGEDHDLATHNARLRVAPPFVDLFERELSDATSRLAADQSALVPAVGLYHGVLEGVVFLAGQAELLARLEEHAVLPGVTAGVLRVQRDERWHVGFGARLLADFAGPAADSEALLAAGRRALAAWGSLVRREIADVTLAGLRRRLRASGLLAVA